MHRFFFYLLILFLPTQLGYHFWPQWSLVLGRRVDYLSPTIFLTDIFAVLTVISYGIQKINISKKLLLPILGLAAFNITFAAQPLVAIVGWLKIIEFLFLFLYIKQTRPPPGRIFFFLSLVVLYSMLLGLTQTVKGGSIGGIFWLLGERSFSLSTPNIAKGVLCFPSFSCIEYLRPYATFPHPNVFAGFLAFYILFAIHQNKKIFIILPIVLLILTLSRTAWFSLGLVLLFRIVKITHWKLMVILLILFAISLLPLPVSHHESIDVRVALNQSALNIIRQFPITGIGVKNFLVSLPDFLPLRTIYFLQPVHNIYLLLLSELGVLSFVVLLIFVFRCKMFRTFRITSSFFLLFLLIGIFDHYPLTLQQGQLLLILALSYSTIPSWQSPQQE
jgi:hypothetical protein